MGSTPIRLATGPRPDTVPAPKTHGQPCLTIERPMLALDNDQLIVRDAERAAACLRLLRGGAGATIRGQTAHSRRSASDCGQRGEAAGAATQTLNTSIKSVRMSR